MRAALQVLLETEPCLEGDVADGSADSLVCHQLSSILEGSMNNKHDF